MFLEILSSVLPSLQWGHVAIPTSHTEEAAEEGKRGRDREGPPCAPSPEAGAGIIKTRGCLRPYSLQMLKGGKGFEDPHQFGKSLGARDGAQPRRQRTEVTPPEQSRLLSEVPGWVYEPQKAGPV